VGSGVKHSFGGATRLHQDISRRPTQLAVLSRTWNTAACKQDGTTAQAPSLPAELQDGFGEHTLLDFTMAQLLGQKSKKTTLLEEQQVALLQRARRVIQLIVPPGVGKREGHIHRGRHPQAPGPTLTVCLHA
jgi:hypothetical protein